jgi:hypothetical protein
VSCSKISNNIHLFWQIAKRAQITFGDVEKGTDNEFTLERL